MRAADLLFWLWRALLAGRSRSLLSALGIAIGIASVTLLTGIGEGLRLYLLDSFSQFGTRLIAVSGTAFRLLDAPAGGTATLRYYRKLGTPEGSSVNAILAAYPDVYLYGCLTEAAIFTQGEAEAQRYLSLYNASVGGLNARTQRITASANPVIRVRSGRTP